MHLHDFFSALDVGDVDVNLSVKSARTHKCGVEDVCTVGCSHDDDAVA